MTTPTAKITKINDTSTTITITTDKDMAAPVYVYYQLDNFYQNHRRYVKSRSDGQLRGEEAKVLTSPDSDCTPLTKAAAPDAAELYPCGLIANSLFNGRCLWSFLRKCLLALGFGFLPQTCSHWPQTLLKSK